MPLPLSLLFTLANSYELTFYSDYASGYAIESAINNGIHVLQKAMTMSVEAFYADLHNLHYLQDYLAGA